MAMGAVVLAGGSESANFSADKLLQDIDRAGASRLDKDLAGDPGETQGRRVGGCISVHRGEIWTDLGQADRIPVTAIAGFSPPF
jgi:hypothetical protein